MTSKNNIIREKILKGLALSSKRLIQTKIDRNQELVISKDGKIVTLSGKDLVDLQKS